MNEGKSIDGFARVDPIQQRRQPINATPPPKKPSKLARTSSFIISTLISVALIIGVVTIFIVYKNTHSSPVPKMISSKVDFPIYYPEQKKLPKGYALNKDSFSVPQAGVVLYAVDYSNGGKLVFSVQKQPSDEEIQNFYANYIPLRNKINTTMGQAEIGAHNITARGKLVTQTVVSLPTNKGSWVIITAPYDTDQAKLKEALNSLKK